MKAGETSFQGTSGAWGRAEGRGESFLVAVHKCPRAPRSHGAASSVARRAFLAIRGPEGVMVGPPGPTASWQLTEVAWKAPVHRHAQAHGVPG